MDLLKRREQVAARAKSLCSVEGSGRHKNDREEKARLAQGDKPLTDKLIGLKDDDRVYLVGPDVARAIEACRSFLAGSEQARRDDVQFTDYDALERHANRVCKRLIEEKRDILAMPTQDWNGLLFVLSYSKIQCVVTDANIVPEEEQ